MTETLLAPDSRPRSEVRPTGTSFAGLVGVELRRLWWRRITRVAAVAVVAFTALAIYNAYTSSSPERLARELDNYKVMVADVERERAEMKDALPQMIEQCRKDEAAERERSGDASVDFACESIAPPEAPTLEQFGIVPPVADAITAGIAQSATLLFAFLAFVLGASAVGAEFTTGSMGNWLTFAPRRVRVALSKLIAVALGSAALTGLGLLLVVGGARMVAVVNRPGDDLALPDPSPLTDSVPQLLLRVLAVAVVGGVAGAALGLVLRHTAAVIGVFLGYAVIVEMMLSREFMEGRLQRWTILTNVDAFVDKGTSFRTETCTETSCTFGPVTVSYTQGWVYLLVLTILLAIVGTLVFRRRDVT